MKEHTINMHQFIKQVYKKTSAVSKKTVFIDRDGTLNEEVNYLHDPNQIHLLPGVLDGIKKLNKYNIVAIIITNQPVIAMGLATIKDIKLINDTLINLLNKKYAYINAVYSCPHHPKADIKKYRIECECRKPKLAMFREAIKDFNINLKSVYLIGDRTADIKAGENLGIPTILVKTGYKGNDNAYSVSPDYICSDFSQAADIIINH